MGHDQSGLSNLSLGQPKVQGYIIISYIVWLLHAELKHLFSASGSQKRSVPQPKICSFALVGNLQV